MKYWIKQKGWQKRMQNDVYKDIIKVFDAEKVDKWITKKGQHIGLNGEGEIIAGNPKVVGKKSNNTQNNVKQSTKSNKLSKNEVNAVNEYTGKKYLTVNSQLREGKVDAGNKKLINEMDNALEKNKLDKDETFYRSANMPELNKLVNSGKAVGYKFSDKAYMSTTESNEVANNYSREKDSVRLVVNAKKGTPSLKIDNEIGAYGDKEQEVLLGRNQTFTVTKVEEVKEKYMARDLNGKEVQRTRKIKYVHVEN